MDSSGRSTPRAYRDRPRVACWARSGSGGAPWEGEKGNPATYLVVDRWQNGDAVTTSNEYPESAPASQALFDRAQRVIPGGVNSPVRAFRAVGGTPRFMASGSGAWLTDADGRRYVDLVSSWGP